MSEEEKKDLDIYNTKSYIHSKVVKEISNKDVKSDTIEAKIKNINSSIDDNLLNGITNVITGTINEGKIGSLLCKYLNIDKKAFRENQSYNSFILETSKGNKYKLVGKIDGKITLKPIDEYIVEIKNRKNRFYYSSREYCQIATYGYLTGMNKAMLVENLNGELRVTKYQHDFPSIWKRKYKKDLDEIVDSMMD